MDIQVEVHPSEIEAALASVAQRFGEDTAANLSPILLANIKHGRFETFASDGKAQLTDYLERMVNCYQQMHLYIDKVQIEKDDLVWIPLYSKISKWIFNLFLRKGFAAAYIQEEIVPELAQEASIQLLKAHFTYDTDFDPWAYMIVNDTCLKFMRSLYKKSAVPFRATVDLDESVEERLEDPRQRLENSFNENRSAIMEAIKKLPPERREVILQKYFYELPSEQIAEKTHRSIAAVYSMHFNAIENLRKILSK